MASNTPPSSFPPSMGPGARPPSSEQQTSSPGSRLQEVMKNRSSYSMESDASRVYLGYEINGQARRYAIPFENMPIGGLTKRICFEKAVNTRTTGLVTIDIIRAAENLTGAPLSQTEAEGFAQHAACRIRNQLVGSALALVGGCLLAARGMKTMKFPFVKPGDPTGYNSFPGQFWPLLRGPPARAMWHLARFTAYGALGSSAAAIALPVILDAVMIKGLHDDKRTSGVLQRMKERGGRYSPVTSNQNRQAAPGAQTQQRQRQQQQQQQQQQTTAMANDMGPRDPSQSQPSGYAETEAFPDDPSQFTQSEWAQSKSKYQQPYMSKPPSATLKSSPSSPSFPSPSSTATPSSSDDFLFDDASPVASAEGDSASLTGARVSNQAASGGESAWARIRRGNASASSPVPAASTPNYSALSNQDSINNNSYSTAAIDEYERKQQAERQQAQREFDSMLERERRLSERDNSWQGVGSSFISTDGVEGGGDGESAWEKRRRS